MGSFVSKAMDKGTYFAVRYQTGDQWPRWVEKINQAIASTAALVKEKRRK